MKSLPNLIFLLVISFYTSAQNFEFGYAYGTPNSMITGMKSDLQGGNIVVTGRCDLTESLDFLNQTSDPLSGNGLNYVASYDTAGNYRWSKKFADHSNDYISDMAVNSDGGIIISGVTKSDTIQFGFINPIKIGTTPGGFNNTYIIYLTADGELNWGYMFYNSSQIKGVCFDSNNNVYIAGMFDDSLVINADIDTTIFNDYIDNVNQSYDGFWAKFSSTGNLQLVKCVHMLSEANSQVGFHEIIATEDNIYVAGSLSGQNIDMDPNSGIDLHGTHSIVGNSNLSLSKYTSEGDYLWTRIANSSSNSTYEELELNSTGKIIAFARVGYYNPLYNINWNYSLPSNSLFSQSTYSTSSFVVEFDTSGKANWVTNTAAYTSGWIYYHTYPMCIDNDDNIYIGAWFQGDSIDIYGGLSTIPEYIYGSNSAITSTGVIKKINPQGNVVWGHAIGESIDRNTIQALTSFNNSLFVGGGIAGSFDLDFSENSSHIVSISKGAVIAKYWIEVINATGNNLITDEDRLISIYPNPSSYKLSISTSLDVKRACVFDFSGKEINSINIIEKNIDVSELANGIYFLRLVTDKGVITKKIIKQ